MGLDQEQTPPNDTDYLMEISTSMYWMLVPSMVRLISKSSLVNQHQQKSIQVDQLYILMRKILTLLVHQLDKQQTRSIIQPGAL